jgi:hypothetical protein
LKNFPQMPERGRLGPGCHGVKYSVSAIRSGQSAAAKPLQIAGPVKQKLASATVVQASRKRRDS